MWLYSNSQQTNKKANRVRDAVRTAEHGDGGLQAAADKNSHAWVMLLLWGKPDDGVGVCRKQPFGGGLRGHLIWKVHLIKTGQRSCLKRIDYSRGRSLSDSLWLQSRAVVVGEFSWTHWPREDLKNLITHRFLKGGQKGWITLIFSMSCLWISCQSNTKWTNSLTSNHSFKRLLKILKVPIRQIQLHI